MVRFINRIIFISATVFLRGIEYFNARLYMRLYLKVLRHVGVKFNGTPRYISSLATFDDFNRITIGNHSVVSKRVIFLTHDYSLTTGLRALGNAPETDIAFVKPITIGNNVFLGMNVFVTPGVVVEDNVVVGAGSVLRGRIPENSIVIGNPAIIIDSLSLRAEIWQKRLNNVEHRTD